MAAHRVHAGNEAADKQPEAGRRQWVVPEQAAALISCAPSIPPDPEVHFVTLADRIFWQRIKDEVDPLDSVSRLWSLPSRAGPPAMSGRRADVADRFHQAGISTVVLMRRGAEGRSQVRVAALGCSPRLPTKRLLVVLSCGYGKTSWEIPGPFMCGSQSLVSLGLG